MTGCIPFRGSVIPTMMGAVVTNAEVLRAMDECKSSDLTDRAPLMSFGGSSDSLILTWVCPLYVNLFQHETMDMQYRQSDLNFAP